MFSQVGVGVEEPDGVEVRFQLGEAEDSNCEKQERDEENDELGGEFDEEIGIGPEHLVQEGGLAAFVRDPVLLLPTTNAAVPCGLQSGKESRTFSLPQNCTFAIQRPSEQVWLIYVALIIISNNSPSFS